MKKTTYFLICLLFLFSIPSCSDDDSAPIDVIAAQISSVADIGNEFDGSDIQVTISKSSEEENVLEYRIFVVPANLSSSFSTASAEALTSARYTTVAKTGDNTITTRLAASTLDSEGNSIVQNAYRIFVLTIGIDGFTNALSTPADLALDLTDLVSTIVELPVGAGDIAVDNEGNRYVSNFTPIGTEAAGTIYKVNRQGEFSVFAEGFGAPAGLVFDDENNLFVSDFDEGKIFKVDQEGNATLFADDLIRPRGIAFNSNGDLYAVSAREGTLQHDIISINAAGQKTTFIADVGPELIIQPYGLAFDDEDNLYIANGFTSGTGDILKVTPAGDISVFSENTGDSGYMKYVIFDNVGQLVVTDHLMHWVYRIGPQGGTPIAIAGIGEAGSLDGSALLSSFRQPFGIAYDPETKELIVSSVRTDANLSSTGPTLLRSIRLDRTIRGN